MLLQTLFVFGLPILCLGLFLLILEWPPDPEVMMSVLGVMGLMIGIFGVLLTIVLLVIYQGGYDYHYSIDEYGITATTAGRTAKTNRVVNTLLMMSGRPTEAGAGMLAAARQSQALAWRDVSNFSVNANQRVITLNSGPLPTMLVACDATNYQAILEFIQGRVEGSS
ncbi:hypothetical protein [Candidatus Viridilinea mediisalina]|uniref:Uncharacterized protein n=1 Tax=Candidatus Viridilinea mediisalina TaxID=2024553 RepID=A0A2A6RNQ4_9CHLR|nr:hypothetical protein [Candidatus Viridilinea mediisalina]PDW04489.1 hypothetical protein CJ255_02950 [Candidatus Viridilinea mediisalina]